MPVHYSSLAPVLVVEQVEPTRAFFCDRLGFTATTDIVHDTALGFSIVERGAVRVIIQSDASLRAEAGESSIAGPYKAYLYVDVSDVDELIPQIVDADVVLSLRHTAYGRHEIGIREPGGNVIVFASRTPA